MFPRFQKIDPTSEVFTAERCFIVETWGSDGDPAVSIARARVAPGVTTAWHALEGTIERYAIVSGQGRMDVGDLPPTEVGPGDTVFIPAGVPQRIANIGGADLVFYCVCTPRFTPDCYRDLDRAITDPVPE